MGGVFLMRGLSGYWLRTTGVMGGLLLYGFVGGGALFVGDVVL